jgi:hypothetical protein
MLKSLFAGIGFALIVIIAAAVTGKWDLLGQICGLVGLGAMLIGAILSGALVSGDRMRTNFAYERKEERNRRINWATMLLLFGLPNLAVVIVSLYL